MDDSFEYVFPAIRGTQAGHEYYVAMCPLRLLPKLFIFNEEELAPELRAQRRLNRARIPRMAQYVLENRETYAFSAITASIDGDARFEPTPEEGHGTLGKLHVGMTARFVINDGQHRRAAVERALKEEPTLADETIAVVFYLDQGLERCQQLFADLNRYAIRPTKSLGLLYDHRDWLAQVVKEAILENDMFRDLVEMEKSTLSVRSRKLFTLSALYGATQSLLADLPKRSPEEWAGLVDRFWRCVADQLPEWQAVRERKMTAAEVRRDFIISHGIALQSIGRAGNTLIRAHSSDWESMLGPLGSIDWSRSNGCLWEGRAMSGGRVSKAGNNITLTANVVKSALGIDLTPEERRVEEAYQRGESH